MTTHTMRGSVLVVDTDEPARELLLALLRAHGYAAEGVGSGESALARLAGARDGHADAPARAYDVVLLDAALPGRRGVDVLIAARAAAPDTAFVMTAASASVDAAVDAMKHGASDYLRKPLRTDELLDVVERAIADVRGRREEARLRRRQEEGMRARLLGRAPVMEALWERIAQVAPTRATVLITGETGTGKELVARAIHELSPRARQPFIASNCSSLPETLLESELFGHVKGSFTGAIGPRRGLFEEANHGTLFMDEVSTLAPGIQVKLLRVVQERTIQRVGSNLPIAVDLRLLAATNVDLAAEVERGAFRADLFYRLNVFPIRVPPLRERREDVPLLARHFLLRAAAEAGRTPPALPAPVLRAMQEYDWPGNVRQLENFVESAVIACTNGAIEFTPPDAPMVRRAGGTRIPVTREPVAQSLAEMERERIMQALVQARGHHGRAAAILGIDRRTVERKLKRYEMAERVPPGTQ